MHPKIHSEHRPISNSRFSPCAENIPSGVNVAWPMKSLKPTTGWLWLAPIPSSESWLIADFGKSQRPLKKGLKTTSRTAERPGQTLNIDLCFVPQTHEIASKLPAVSGSSGRLIIEPIQDQEAAPNYPGQVFEDEKLSYTQAMTEFVQASEKVTISERADMSSTTTQKRELRRQDAQLRSQRRKVRQQRALEDSAWKTQRAERKQQQSTFASRSNPERDQLEDRWKACRQQRKQTQKKREIENQLWRQKREHLIQQWSQLPLTVWIAILVITDNCTRQCLGLPLFVAGAKVTSEMIVQALKELLPPELCFLITDRGTHFRAKVFDKLARSFEFVHVLIARRRPQSNGIAERFIRTLKEWLMDEQWGDEHQLRACLQQFVAFYNDRPHQGLPVAGLSPNEFAKRVNLYNFNQNYSVYHHPD